MILLDTTCLVYAVGDDHERRASAQALIEAAANGSVVARTTGQVIVEFAHVRGRRRDREDAASLAQAFTDLLGPLEVSASADVTSALRLWRSYPEIGSLNALLLAVGMRTGAEAVVSDDASLARVGVVPVLTAAAAVQRFVD